VISLWKRWYGASPLHLLGQLVALAIAVYAFAQVVDVRSTDNLSLAIWLVGALLHDMLFVPVYLTLDLITRLGIQDHALRDVRAVNHIRVPVVMSAVLFLTLFPLILGRGEANFERVSGVQQPDYLARWLLVTAVLFAVSAVAYAVRVRRDAVRHRRARSAPPPPAGSVAV
jgi:hypothetical protein